MKPVVIDRFPYYQIYMKNNIYLLFIYIYIYIFMHIYCLYICFLSLSLSIYIYIYMYMYYSFECSFHQLMVFHWSDSKSPWISRTLCILTDLNNAVVWMVFTRPLISKSSSFWTKPLVTVPSMQSTIGITVNFLFHIFSLLYQGLAFRFLSVLLWFGFFV